jgi:4-amino-4-deoxy-L-arabinose transferase-like glycosyltransferase
MLCLVDRHVRGAHRWQLPVLALALGVALLAKGPVALLVVVGAMVGMRWLAGPGCWGERPFAWRAALAVTAALALFLAWALPANEATGGELAARGLGRHVAQRMIQPLEGHGGRGLLYVALLPFYLPVLLLGCFPWTLHLPVALQRLATGGLGDRARVVLLGWIVPTVLVMSLVATKLPHYVLPVFPALAVTIAGYLTQQRVYELRGERRSVLIGRWVATSVALLMAIGLLAAAWWLDPLPSLLLRVMPLALVLVGGAVLALRARRPSESVMPVLAASVAVLVIVPLLVMPRIELLFKIGPRIGAVIRTDTVASDERLAVYTYRYEEPTVSFYVGRSPQHPVRRLKDLVPNRHVRLDLWANDPGRAVLVTTQAALAEAPADAALARLRRLGSWQILNYSKEGTPNEVIVVVRDNPGVDPYQHAAR